MAEKILIVEDIWDSIVAEEDYPELTKEQQEYVVNKINEFIQGK